MRCRGMIKYAYTGLFGAIFLLTALAPEPVWAACIQSGTDVRCAGTPGGFVAGTGVNGLTVVVDPGAVTTDNGTQSIGLNNNNTVTNNGTISASTLGALGLQVGTNNFITNNGTISTTGAASTALAAGSATTITNEGKITSIGDFGVTVALGSNNTLTNNGTISGAGDTNTTVSSGTGSTVTNNGSIVATGPSGIAYAVGNNSTLNNNGLISAGVGGISLNTNSNTGATFNNNASGTIDGRIAVTSANNNINNRGLITITNSGTAVGAAHSLGGTFTNFSGGTLELRGNSAGVSDTFSANTVTLNSTGGGGTLRIAPQAGLYGTTTNYAGTVNATTAVNGTFNQVTSASPFFTASAVYNAASVDVSLTRIGFASPANLNGNQRAIGNALDRSYSPNATGAAATIYSNLLASTSTAPLDQLTGSGTTGTQSASFSSASLFQGALADRGAAWRGGGGFAQSGGVQIAMNTASDLMSDASLGLALDPARPLRAWASMFGSIESLAGDATTGAGETNVSSGGGAVGMEKQLAPDLLIGFGIGGSGSGFSVSGQNTSGTQTGVQIGVYGIKTWDNFYASGSFGYGYFDNSTLRTIAGLGPTETATGEFSANQLGGRLEVGNRFDMDGYGVTPFGVVEGSVLWQDGYTESTATSSGSAGVLGLTYQAQTIGSLPTTLGVQFDRTYKSADGTRWSPFVRLGWQHEFYTTRQVNAALTAIPSTGFTAQGARVASDTAKLDVGVNLLVSPDVSVFVKGDGQFAGTYLAYGGKGGAKWAF